MADVESSQYLVGIVEANTYIHQEKIVYFQKILIFFYF